MSTSSSSSNDSHTPISTTTLLPLWFISSCYRVLAFIYSRIFLLRHASIPILKHEHMIEPQLDYQKPYHHATYLDLVTGAFPSSPLPHLPTPFDRFEALLDLVNRPDGPLSLGEDMSEEALARRASGAKWRAQVRALPVYDLSRLKGDKAVLQRAHAVLAWLVHFYVHSTPPPPNKVLVVPATLAQPLVQVSRWLQIAPVLTYADTVLWNFELSDVNKPFSPNNMTFTSLFNKGTAADVDESEFYRCCAWIEQRGFDCTKLITDLIIDIESPVNTQLKKIDQEAYESRIAEHLMGLVPVVNDLTDILMSVKNACRPNTFYSSIRPWYRGSDSEGNGLRWVYEGVEGSESLELSGPSAGQTSTFHVLDALLGVEHDERSRPFMKRMLQYMPSEQRALLLHIQHHSQHIRDLVKTSDSVRAAYNNVLEAMTKFRTDHLQVAVRYVVSPKDKCPMSGMTVAMAAGKGKECPVNVKSRGTGGNEVSTVLKGSRDSTKSMRA
ncbi:hypothetical protein FRB96_009330 [Tulasnella sp. 330]|nr:hypothetical protein FRB96_009330 [Tulasnella sp. 330]KAG8885242.1 hypothetical protein FRB97_001688 [Tulasnella sp. 331]KAG8887600.1 hypothetical protein FRB98_009328 [Tulasnella sp. 332]